MASNFEKSDDEYNRSLRTLMQSCLPAILVEIVDVRPQDPVQYLAHALYRFRENEGSVPNNKVSSRFSKSGVSVQTKQEPVSVRSMPCNSVKPGTITNRRDQCVRLVEEDPLLHELEDDEQMVDIGNITQTLLHKAEQLAIQAIGDLFDDSDIT